MSFTIKATYKNQNKTIQFDTPAIPPHAIINAKVSNRSIEEERTLRDI